MGSLKYSKVHALDRGWTGSKMPGRSIGCPDPIGEGENLKICNVKIMLFIGIRFFLLTNYKYVHYLPYLVQLRENL